MFSFYHPKSCHPSNHPSRPLLIHRSTMQYSNTLPHLFYATLYVSVHFLYRFRPNPFFLLPRYSNPAPAYFTLLNKLIPTCFGFTTQSRVACEIISALLLPFSPRHVTNERPYHISPSVCFPIMFSAVVFATLYHSAPASVTLHICSFYIFSQLPAVFDSLPYPSLKRLATYRSASALLSPPKHIMLGLALYVTGPPCACPCKVNLFVNSRRTHHTA